MTRFIHTRVLPLLAASALMISPYAAAQTDPASGGDAAVDEAVAPAPQGEIVIPDNVRVFADNNPNLRRATAVVNGDIITGTDVDQRLALILAANQGKIADDEKQRLRLQVLRNLIDETLQIQEAKANKVDIDDAEVNQTYARVAQQNFGQNTGAMDAYLAKVGSAPASLKRQIRGELAWQGLLRRNVAPFVNVSGDEVNETLARMQAAKGSDEYRIGEIYLAAPAETKAQVYQNATQIVDQLRKGGSFTAYARQYSQSSTKSVGGDLGWLRLALLPPELSTAAGQMERGQLAGPIENSGGYSIIYIIDKRQVLTSDPRDALLSLKQVSINFPAGVSEADASKQAAAFATAMHNAKGCGAVDQVAASIGAQVVENDQVRARDLPAPLQTPVLNLSIGETSPPFGSIKDGVRVLMLCGRDDAKAASGPSFDDMMSQMEDDRINKRAQAYLRDLRRDAVIEYD